MILYRSMPKNDGDYSASYTVTVDGIKQKPSFSRRHFNETTYNPSDTVIVGNNICNVREMFSGCTEFNQEVIFPDNIEDCTRIFWNCFNLNSIIKLPNNAKNCYGTFTSCNNLNQNIIIPNNVTNCFFMFHGCNSYYKDIIVPNKVVDLHSFISGYTPAPNIYIKGQTYRDIYIYGLIGGDASFKYNQRHNIFFNRVLNNVFNRTSSSTSITGHTMSWTSMVNGFYNQHLNVYCYYNYEG